MVGDYLFDSTLNGVLDSAQFATDLWHSWKLKQRIIQRSAGANGFAQKRQASVDANGFVHLPEKAEWLPEYLHELTTFPKGKHDDQADSTSQALDWVRQGYWGPGMGIFNYYRIAHEKMMKEQGAR
jgi:hypothetical protein